MTTQELQTETCEYIAEFYAAYGHTITASIHNGCYMLDGEMASGSRVDSSIVSHSQAAAYEGTVRDYMEHALSFEEVA